MNEPNFSLDEIKSFIETEIPDTEKGELLELLADTNADEASLDLLGEKFFAEHTFLSIPLPMTAVGDTLTGGIGRKKKTDWQDIKSFLYKIFCTESGKKSRDSFKSIVTAIIDLIPPQSGVPAQELIKFVSKAVIIVFVMKIDNFCTVNKSEFEGE
jgi:hypothetical protein